MWTVAVVQKDNKPCLKYVTPALTRSHAVGVVRKIFQNFFPGTATSILDNLYSVNTVSPGDGITFAISFNTENVKELSDKDFKKYTKKWERHFKKLTREMGEYDPFGWDWATFRVYYPEEYQHIQKMKEEYKRRLATKQ